MNVDPLHPRHGTCFHDSIWHCDGVDSVHDTLEKYRQCQHYIVLHTKVEKVNYIVAFNLTVRTPCHKPISFLQSNTLTSVSPETEMTKAHEQRCMQSPVNRVKDALFGYHHKYSFCGPLECILSLTIILSLSPLRCSALSRREREMMRQAAIETCCLRAFKF